MNFVLKMMNFVGLVNQFRTSAIVHGVGARTLSVLKTKIIFSMNFITSSPKCSTFSMDYTIFRMKCIVCFGVTSMSG